MNGQITYSEPARTEDDGDEDAYCEANSSRAGRCIATFSTDGVEEKVSKKCADGGHLVAMLYTITLTLLGVAFPMRDALQKTWLTTYIEAIYLVYLYGMSFIFIIFVEIYVIRASLKHGRKRKHPKQKAKIMVQDRSTDTESTQEMAISTLSYVREISTTSSNISTNSLKIFIVEEEQEEDSIDGNVHYTSLYVRTGAVIFGLGNMVYDGLLLQQIQSHQHNKSSCLQASFVWPNYFHLAFLLAQTYFIFKRAKIHVTYMKPLVRLAFMHLFATNICIWFRTMIRETLESFLFHNADGAAHNSTAEGHPAENLTKSGIHCNFEEDMLIKASPYLFPCVMEYSLLAAAVMCFMYSEVGTEQRVKDVNKNKLSQDSKKDELTEINFHKSHKGLFTGMTVIAATCVSIILFFSYIGQSQPTCELIYHVTMLGLYGLVLVATMISFIQLQMLSHQIGQRITSVDDMMLAVAMGGCILFQMLKLLPLFTYGIRDASLIMSLAESVLAIVVSLLQTAFILDTSHRVTRTQKQYRNKPGRESITFLLCANVALWLFRTFHMKEVEYEGSIQEQQYGYLTWQLMLHSLVPLIIFYHYHSSACLARIWSDTYSHQPLQDLEAKDTGQLEKVSLNEDAKITRQDAESVESWSTEQQYL